MAKDAKPRKTTEYVVLVNFEDQWSVMLADEGAKTFVATSAADAVKQAAALEDKRHPQHEAPSSMFSAVPARSWKPMQRTVERVTKETWS